MVKFNEQADFDLDGSNKKHARLEIAQKRLETIRKACLEARKSLGNFEKEYPDFCVSEEEKAKALTEFNEAKERIRKKYDLEIFIVNNKRYGGIRTLMWPLRDLIQTNNLIKDLEAQMIKLPPNFFKRLGLKG